MSNSINIYQKLLTQYELLPMELENIDKDNSNWPSNKSKYVYWAQEKLNFRVVNSKLLVDSPLKKELLEAWTTSKWYKMNTVEDMKSRLEVDNNSPYLYGNKLDLDLEVLGNFFLERLEEVKTRKLKMLEEDVFLEDFTDVKDNSDIMWPDSIKPIAERMQLAIDNIMKEKNCTVNKCETCGIYCKLFDNEVLGFHNSNSADYPGTWNDLEYYIYQIMTNYSMGNLIQNRCWLCEMTRETWNNKEISKKIEELNEIDIKLLEKNKSFMTFPNTCMSNNTGIGWNTTDQLEPDSTNGEISCGYYMGDEMCPSSNV